jgi:hypothetical protein
VQETPSEAAALGAVIKAAPMFAKTSPWAPCWAAVKRCIGMWHVEHLSSMAARAAGWSMTSRRTAACQYGSRAELAIIEARHE